MDELENLVTACWDCNRGKGPMDANGEPDYEEDQRWAESCSDADFFNDSALEDEMPPWLMPETPRFNIRMTTEQVFVAASEIPSPIEYFYPELDQEPF